jgi:glyoxylase-like metal-dependent hydrolase (beta-lactamase superfamily II)
VATATRWEIVPLVDTEGSFATFAEAFPDLTTAERDAARAQWAECFRGDDWWLPFRVLLLRGPSLIVVDAGVGPSPTDFLPGSETRLPQELERAGVGPSDIAAVVFTHLHIDHVGWGPLFTSARAFVQADEWAYFDRPLTHEKLGHFAKAGRLELVDGEQEIAPGIFAIPTRGHTPGHMSLRVDDTFVIGDVVVHPVQFADPAVRFPLGDHEHERAAATRRSTLSLLADEGARVASPHLPGVFGRVVRSGGGFSWEPEG